MFNHEAYQRRLDELKEQQRSVVDQLDPANREAWHKDVSLRYGRFLAARSAEQLQRAIEAFAGYEHVDDKQKHRDYCAQEIMGVVAGIHASSALIRGAVLTADPIGAEAMMQIFDEANDVQPMVQAAKPTDEQLQAFSEALRKRGPGNATVILDTENDPAFEAAGSAPLARH